MHHLDLILTLTGGLATALVLGYLTHRLGLSPIVGYLVGGIVIGPHTPGFVANQALAEQLAEVGVILLMFGVGLQFHLRAAGRAACRSPWGCWADLRGDGAGHCGGSGVWLGLGSGDRVWPRAVSG